MRLVYIFANKISKWSPLNFDAITCNNIIQPLNDALFITPVLEAFNDMTVDGSIDTVEGHGFGYPSCSIDALPGHGIERSTHKKIAWEQ